jgi:hypothetical protein
MLIPKKLGIVYMLMKFLEFLKQAKMGLPKLKPGGDFKFSAKRDSQGKASVSG